LRAFAKPLGVRILLENIPNELSIPDKLVEFIQITHFDDVGICFDVGHAHIMSNVAEAFEILKGHIHSTHVHDNAGDRDSHLWPGAGTIEWKAAVELLRSAPSDPLISVSLSDDPAVTAIGRVREVSPQADPVTRTFEVKVGLTDPPAAMRLGATVVGRMKLDTAPVIEIPATALTEFDRRPAVWVVDPSSLTVSLRNVEVARNDPATIAISQGLDSGEIVVTAGTQALHPGQKTRLLESAR
jgi:hypothetical protein